MLSTFYGIQTFQFAVRQFSTSLPLSALHNHKLYPKVDWEKVDAGQYAVVDPVNPGVILYLSEQDYIIMVRVAITSNKTLKVLAVPGDAPVDTSSKPDSQNSSQNSPPRQEAEPASWLRTFLLGTRTSTGQRGRKRTRYLFSTRLLPFTVVMDGASSNFSLSEGILMVKLTYGNILQWFQTWHDTVSWWSRGSQQTTVSRIEANSFGLRCRHFLKHQGINALITRFKICLYVVAAYLGGRKLSSTADLGMRIRLRKGLPAFLPYYIRNGLRHGNLHVIRIWSSMFFSYKGLVGSWIEPVLQEGSITREHPLLDGSPAFIGFSAFARELCEYLRNQLGIKSPDLTVKNPFFTVKAGPNHPVSLLGAGLDAYLWWLLDSQPSKSVVWPDFESSGLSPSQSEDGEKYDTYMRTVRRVTGVKRNLIRLWLEATSQTQILKNLRVTAKAFALVNSILINLSKDSESSEISIRRVSASAGKNLVLRRLKWITRIFGENLLSLRWVNPTLQRLHNLYEPAGKVRTIAIVDYWTNYVLKPLHDWMFDILTLLPQDATFDQEGRVKEFAERGYTDVYSYDLKSATDLIPLALYRALLSHFLPEKVLNIWIDLLVDRDFLVPKSTMKQYPKHASRIRYGTGQPMGALTSWASMALVHHALVLYAALLAERTTIQTLLLFRDYMVLGDDIVIADAKVAAKYIWLMEELHIPVGLAKSHISQLGLFNFANQTYLGSVNVSPVSLREEINANSLPARAELALRLARRGWKDLQSRTWLVPLLKVFFNERMWCNSIGPIVRRRDTHPIIQWIIATILTPGTTRFGFTGMSNVSLDVFLTTVLSRARLWTTRIGSVKGILYPRPYSDAYLISILGKWISKIYNKFLTNRNLLGEFESWVQNLVSVDLEWLLTDIFSIARKDAIERWASRHRLTLKEMQIASKLTAITDRKLFGLAVGEEWNHLVHIVAKAEAELPLVPDFTVRELSVLAPDGLGGGGSQAALQRQLDSFRRVTELLGMIDHLGPTGTPGFVEPGINSQSEYLNNLCCFITSNKSP